MRAGGGFVWSPEILAEASWDRRLYSVSGGGPERWLVGCRLKDLAAVAAAPGPEMIAQARQGPWGLVGRRAAPCLFFLHQRRHANAVRPILTGFVNPLTNSQRHASPESRPCLGGRNWSRSVSQWWKFRIQIYKLCHKLRASTPSSRQRSSTFHNLDSGLYAQRDNRVCKGWLT